MIKKALLLGMCLFSAASVAAERNDIPSCYAYSNTMAAKPAPSGRMLTVIVDQTTPLDEGLQRKAWANIKGFMKPGDKIRMYSFSAYLEGRYTKLEYSGELEGPLPEAALGDVAISSAKKLNSCLKTQPAYLWKSFGKAFRSSMGQSSNTIPRSEILFSLKEISKDLGKLEGVSDQVVLLMSDMLEFSDFGSFYASNSIREIDPATEMAKVHKMDMLADFGGARVFVHGAAFVPTGQKYGYRSGKLITRLSSFWDSYFKESNAVLESFGSPELTTAVQ